MIGPTVFTQAFAAGISQRWGLRVPGAPYCLAAGLVFASIFIAAMNVERGGAASQKQQTR